MISLLTPGAGHRTEAVPDFRRVAPACEVECLESAERKRVLGIVEEKSILPAAGPAVQAILQLANNVAEAGNGPLFRLQCIDSLNRIPQLALLFEVEPVTLFVAFNQYAEEAEEELQVLFP